MSDNKAFTPIEQRQVVFYEDEITTVIVDADGQRDVYVPARPIGDYLVMQWNGLRNETGEWGERIPLPAKWSTVMFMRMPPALFETVKGTRTFDRKKLTAEYIL